MGNKIADHLAKRGPHFVQAGGNNHHLQLGPGPELESSWTADGLELPDLPAMRRYRIDRVTNQLEKMGYDGLIVMDPMNIRYTTDTTNMQVWVMHNASRYAWIGLDGSVIVWEFYNCDYLSGHNPIVTEVRPAVGATYFLTGNRHSEQAKRWGEEMLDVIAEHCGPSPRIAVDQAPYECYRNLEAGGVTIGSGQEVMEQARAIKSSDEIKAMRCAMHACETTMSEMHSQLQPGMTERELWAKLHEGNIRRAGEWIETQILASGPRTNPWMQEVSSRVMNNGDLVGYDTDLVGAYGMMVDISRTWLVGDGTPSTHQRQIFDLATEQLQRNRELLQPGTSFRDLTHKAWFPTTDTYDHYCVLFHGVGQCDEYPSIYFPEFWDSTGYDGHLEPGMVLTVEAYVGRNDGVGEGVKLEDQFLVTESGPEQLSSYPLDLVG